MLFRPGSEEVTVDQIVERIPKDRRHTKLEAEVQALRTRWGELHDQQRKVIAENAGNFGKAGHAAERQISEIERELKATETKRRDAGVLLAPLRAEYGSRLGQALKPRQKELAGQALEALESLADVWAELEALTQLVESEGGSLGRVPPLQLFLLERELQKLAGES